MILSAIVAQSSNRVIGRNNDIPWRGKLKGEQKLFKEATEGKIVVMGRRTWESIPEKYRPLPNRINIVLSSSQYPLGGGCITAASVQDAIDLGKSLAHFTDEMVFIGGQRVYEEIIPRLDTLYLTTLSEEFEGDTYFPEVEVEEWYIEDTMHFEKEEGRVCSFKLETMHRIF